MPDELKIILKDEDTLEIELQEGEDLKVKLETDVVEVVTSDYEKLNNLPKINNVELVGNKTAKDLSLQEEMDILTNLEIEEILKM